MVKARSKGAIVDASVNIGTKPIDVPSNSVAVYSGILKVEYGHYLELVFLDKDGKIANRRTFRRTL